MPAIVQLHYVHIRSQAAVATDGISNVDVSRVCHQSAFLLDRLHSSALSNLCECKVDINRVPLW